MHLKLLEMVYCACDHFNVLLVKIAIIIAFSLNYTQYNPEAKKLDLNLRLRGYDGDPNKLCWTYQICNTLFRLDIQD